MLEEAAGGDTETTAQRAARQPQPPHQPGSNQPTGWFFLAFNPEVHMDYLANTAPRIRLILAFACLLAGSTRAQDHGDLGPVRASPGPSHLRQLPIAQDHGDLGPVRRTLS
jgi:hypothetical protein